MREINFERTVWAERQLAKLCPNNDINKLGELVSTTDFDAQIDVIEKMIVIMNEAAERKAHFLDNSHEINVITIDELECITEKELMALTDKAFSVFYEDGKPEIETEPKKTKADQKKSI